jgi:hypothetical protein
MRHFWRFLPNAPTPIFKSVESEESFISTLSECALRDIREEIGVLVTLVESIEEGSEKERILKEMLRLLNKLAHKKYRAEFNGTLAMLRTAAHSMLRAGPRFSAGLDTIEERARRRMETAVRPAEHPILGPDA